MNLEEDVRLALCEGYWFSTGI